MTPLQIAPQPRPPHLDAQQALALNLLPHREEEGTGGRRIVALLLILLLGCGVAAAGWWSWNAYQFGQERSLLAPGLQDLRRQYVQLRQERSELAALRDERSYLIENKRQTPSSLLLLEELSKILPDGVWLTALKLDGNTAVLAGLSGDASALPSLLEASALFKDASFAATTRRDDATGKERFQISLTVLAPPEKLLGAKP